MILGMLLLVLTIVQQWRRGGDLYVILLFEGGEGEVLRPSFEQKDDAKIAASAGGCIRVARQCTFLFFLILKSTIVVLSAAPKPHSRLAVFS